MLNLGNRKERRFGRYPIRRYSIFKFHSVYKHFTAETTRTLSFFLPNSNLAELEASMLVFPHCRIFFSVPSQNLTVTMYVRIVSFFPDDPVRDCVCKFTVVFPRMVFDCAVYACGKSVVEALVRRKSLLQYGRGKTYSIVKRFSFHFLRIKRL